MLRAGSTPQRRELSEERLKLVTNTYQLMALMFAFSATTAFLLIQSGLWIAMASPTAFITSLAALFGAMYLLSKTSESGYGIFVCFLIAILLGATAAPLLALASSKAPDAVVTAFSITAVTLLLASVYAKVTGRALDGWRNFLFVGLIVLIVAMIINIFIGSDLSSAVISGLGAVLFALLILFDIARLHNSPYVGNYIDMAVDIYLDAFNMFVHLLNLLLRID